MPPAPFSDSKGRATCARRWRCGAEPQARAGVGLGAPAGAAGGLRRRRKGPATPCKFPVAGSFRVAMQQPPAASPARGASAGGVPCGFGRHSHSGIKKEAPALAGWGLRKRRFRSLPGRCVYSIAQCFPVVKPPPVAAAVLGWPLPARLGAPPPFGRAGGGASRAAACFAFASPPPAAAVSALPAG